MKWQNIVALITLTGLILAACGTASRSAPLPAAAKPTRTDIAPAWFQIKMTDVLTGQLFAIGDFAGKVVLIETMAEWCTTCALQQEEVRKLHEQLGNPADVVSISLDVDLHEDEASLKKYATNLGYNWRVAVAPLEVARALGNLYSAEYLNPPLSPMLLIDRSGAAYSLPYGVKKVALLRDELGPYLLH